MIVLKMKTVITRFNITNFSLAWRFKMKRAVKLVTAVVTLFLIINTSVFADGTNLVTNDGFEQGDLQNLIGWTTSAWDTADGVTEFSIDETVSHSGTRSALIVNNSANDSRFKQEIKVDEKSYYKLSCWIKAENAGPDAKGANISIDGTHNSSADIRDTGGEWEYVEFYGKTNKGQKNFFLTIGIGGYSSINTGKAWFDDVTVEKIDKLPAGANAVNMFIEQTSDTPSNTVDKSNDISAMYPYTIGFLTIGILLFVLMKKNIIKMQPGREKLYLVLLFAAGLIFRIVVAPIIEGFSVDIGCFKAWASAAANDLPNFYNSGMFCDYPPLYILVLALLQHIINLFNLGANPASHIIMIKLPSMLADLVTAYLIYRMASKQFKPEQSILFAGLYIFNPAIFLNSTLWGQVDSFFTMMIVIFLMLIKTERKPLATAVAAAAFLMKPQAVIIAPVLMCELFIELFRRRNYKNVILSVVYAIATVVLILLPFSIGKSPLWIVDLYKNTASGYDQASLNAFNLFALLGGNLKSDSETLFIFSYGEWGWTSFVLLCLGLTPLLYYLYNRAKNSNVLFIAALVQSVGTFVLWTRMHERYLFPAVALALIAYIYIKDIRILALFGGLSITAFINTQVVLSQMLLTDYPHIDPDNPVLLLVSLANVLLLVFLVWTSLDIAIRKKIYNFKDAKMAANIAAISGKK